MDFYKLIMAKSRECRDNFDLLLNNINEPIEIVLQNDSGCVYGKSLESMPTFTIKEIEEHRLNSAKSPELSIKKTLDRGLKFKNERYLSADFIFTKSSTECFFVKAQCKASMKNIFRKIEVCMDKLSGKVLYGECDCPAGQCGYCNHVMALLFELADYSLNKLSVVPEEMSCTSRLRQWGLPGLSSGFHKAPIMDTTLLPKPNSKGISSTLYDPRINKSMISKERLAKLKESLRTVDNRIGFAHIIPDEILPGQDYNEVKTKFGLYPIGAPLSYHLNPIGYDFTIVTNIAKQNTCSYTIHKYQKLPLHFINIEHEVIPKHWTLTKEEMN